MPVRQSMHVMSPVFRHFVPLVSDIVVHTPPTQTTEFFYISLKKLLIQGAYPIDSNIISRDDQEGELQFQGGYRCFHEIIDPPAHGSARLSWDRLGFEYRPSIGYVGGDSFTYRLRNVTGQESNLGCISLFVRV